MTPEQEADRLTVEWMKALAQYQRTEEEADGVAEQAAYDQLIDHVEANGLNYTKFDPRGDM